MEQPPLTFEPVSKNEVTSFQDTKKYEMSVLKSLLAEDPHCEKPATQEYIDGWHNQQQEALGKKNSILDFDLQTASTLERRGETEHALEEYRHILDGLGPIFSEKDEARHDELLQLSSFITMKCRELEDRLKKDSEKREESLELHA